MAKERGIHSAPWRRYTVYALLALDTALIGFAEVQFAVNGFQREVFDPLNIIGKPVNLDRQGRPIIKIAEILPTDTELESPIYSKPSVYSEKIGSIRPYQKKYVIEIYGNPYKSIDDKRGNYYVKVNDREKAVGRWFQLTDGTTGYVNGNNITIIKNEDTFQKSEP